MTREEAGTQALEGVNKSKCIILELATGYGKTKLSIDCTNKACERVYREEECEADILILVAKTVQKFNFQEEVAKWGGIKSSHITIECYESLHKYKDSHFDIVICDEAQHLSEARLAILKSIHISYNIFILSATLPRAIKKWVMHEYPTTVVKVALQEAISNGVLPDPTIYMIPLTFNDVPYDHILANGGKGLPKAYCTTSNWSKARFDKTHEWHVMCTDKEFYKILSDWIDYCKSAAMNGKLWARTKWQRLCNDRLLWLADIKTQLLISLREHFKNYRTLTFCGRIEQASAVCKNAIHSKNKNRIELLKKFNAKKIKHLSTVHIMNEGLNLTDCRIGIIGNINASEIIIPQRIGRVLRHKKPVLIIPYFINTREQEILEKTFAEYNKDLIKVARSLDEISINTKHN